MTFIKNAIMYKDMKKIFILTLLILILSGCAQKDPLQGRTEKEIAACNLIQEFVVFQIPETEDVLWIDCFFDDPAQYISNDDRWVAIFPKPSKEHPNYDKYIENKKYREQEGLEEPPSTLLVDIDNQIILDPNVNSQIKYMYFQKNEADFTRPTTEEIVEIYGSDVYGDILGE